MNSEEIEQLLKDQLGEQEKGEISSYTEHFLKTFNNNLSELADLRDFKQAADLYRQIGVEIKHITEHYEQALLEVKKQLRKDLKSCDKVNWVQHIRNNQLDGLTEDKIRDLIEIYKDPTKFFKDDDIKQNQELIKKCQNKFDQVRITMYENLEKMLSQVFLQFKTVNPLKNLSPQLESFSSAATVRSLSHYTDGHFFSVSDNGQAIAIRSYENGDVMDNYIQTLQEEINAFVILDPSTILLHEKQTGSILKWNPPGNNEFIPLDFQGDSSGDSNLKIQLFSNGIVATSTNKATEIAFLEFNEGSFKPYGHQISFNNTKNEDKKEDDSEESDKNRVAITDFAELQHKDQNYVVVSYDNSSVIIYEFSATLQGHHKEWRRLKRTHHHDNSFISVLNVINENLIAGGGCDRDPSLEIWDLSKHNDLTVAQAPSRIFKGHMQRITKVILLSSTLVISASEDLSLRIWNIRSGTKLREFRLHNLITDVIVAKQAIIVSTQNGVFQIQ